MILDAVMFGAYVITIVICLDRLLPLLTCIDFLFLSSNFSFKSTLSDIWLLLIEFGFHSLGILTSVL